MALTDLIKAGDAILMTETARKQANYIAIELSGRLMDKVITEISSKIRVAASSGNRTISFYLSENEAFKEELKDMYTFFVYEVSVQLSEKLHKALIEAGYAVDLRGNHVRGYIIIIHW